MATSDSLTSNRIVAGLRDASGRIRSSMRGRHPAVRLGMVVAPFLLLVAAGYWAAATRAPSGPRFLAQGRPFSSDDLIKIFKALDEGKISYRPDDRRIEVAADQYDQATAVLARLDVGLRPFSAIRGTTPSFPELLGSTADREQRERLHDEQLLEQFIDRLPGVVWSLVCIRQPPKAPLSRVPRGKPSAFVYLESESDRLLDLHTIQAIQMIVRSNHPELGEAITVMDRKGRPYLDPSDPALGKLTRDRVREQELREEVADRLSWIEGVRIFVEVGDRRQATAAKEQRAPAPPAVGVEPIAAVAVNQPADLGPPEPPAAPTVAAEPERGRVLVYVPRSFYFNRMLPHPDRREPSVEELRDAAGRIEQQVEEAIRPLLPSTWMLDVETIPDELPATRTASLAGGSDRRRSVADWGIVGAVAAAVAVVMAMGSWIQAARRPSAPPPSVSRRYREDPAEDPGPSERVRELVRRDPEAAASVLRRWAIQGGPSS